MSEKKPHNIPIDHFDFDYLTKCENIKEIEKIVQVLRSQHEGHFPDLTKFAEDRLKVVAPNSKILRVESAIGTKHTMLPEEFAAIITNVAVIEKKIIPYFTI
jgi:sperm-associated antigen 1